MKKIPILLAVAFILGNLCIINNYGINWDSPEHFMRGNAILNFFLTGKKTFDASTPTSPVLMKPGETISRYAPEADEYSEARPTLPDRPQVRKEHEELLRTIGKRVSFYQSQYFNILYYQQETLAGHLPLADILSAAGNAIGYRWLGVVGDIASYQLFSIVLGALGVYIVSRFAFELTDSWVASLISGAALALYPSFLAHVHLNVKDSVIAVVWTGTIWSFWHWVKDGRSKWGVLTSIFFIAGLGIKWTIGFLVFVIVPWVLVRRRFHIKSFFRITSVASVAGTAFLFAISPFLWHNPIQKLGKLITYYWRLGIGMERVQPHAYIFSGFNTFPSALVAGMTPEILIVLTVIAGIALWHTRKRDTYKSGLLLILWLLVPILRLTLPGTKFYGGINQFLEIIPAIAVLSGVGAAYAVRLVASRFRWGVWGITSLTLVLLLIPVIRLHPNENLYVNSLLGGLRGGTHKGILDWSTSYGNVYKQAADWLNTHAEPQANIALLNGPTFALSPMFLRSDMSISPNHFSGFEARGEYIVQIPDITGSSHFSYRYPLRVLQPVHTIVVDGVQLVSIFKNDKAHQMVDMSRERFVEYPQGKPGTSVNGDYWEIDVGERARIIRIVLTVTAAGCAKTNSRFIDELIGFTDLPGQPIDTKALIGNQEHFVLPGGEVEYDFAGEVGRFIRIYIQSGLSCFLGARVYRVAYLPLSP